MAFSEAIKTSRSGARSGVASGHLLTTEAAAEVLREGGNAVDAVIAATWMACVAEPVLASAGGGGFSLSSLGGERPKILDFFTQTPRNRIEEHAADFYPVHVDFGATTQEFHIGKASTATPGVVRGLFALHRQQATLPMQRLTAPAVEAAKNGVEVSDYQAYMFKLIAPIFMTTAGSRDVYASQRISGEIVQAGEMVKTPDFADFLDTLAREGERFFYEGEIAQKICGEPAQGSALHEADLQQFQAIWREPVDERLSLPGGDWRIFSNPLPSAGGSLILFALDLLAESFDLAKPKFGESSHLAWLQAAMQLTSEARLAATPSGELQGGRLADLQAMYRRGIKKAFRGTTHISVMDADGGFAAVTVSNGEGCGELVPGTGMMLNNMLGEEDVNPGGFFQWQPNTRMSSMMAPTLALKDNGDALLSGSGGSNRIRSAILQVLANTLFFDLPLDIAVSAPRIHEERGTTYVEGGFTDEAITEFLQSCPQPRRWEDKNMFFGGAHSVLRQAGRAGKALQAVGDLRRGGVAELV